MAFDYRTSGSADDNRKALAADEAALGIEPDDLATLAAYTKDLYRIGSSLEQTGELKTALPYYQRQLEISQKLGERSSAVEYTRNVALA